MFCQIIFAHLVSHFSYVSLPRGIYNGAFWKWGDNRVKVSFQMGRFDSAKIVLKVPYYIFSLEAHIEGAFITIRYKLE